MKRTIKHVFFDLDHTLWDFDRNSGLTFKKIFEVHRLDINLNEFLEVYKPIILKYWKLYREERVSKPDLRYGRLKEAFDHLEFKVDDETINKLSVDYIGHLTTFKHLFDGTIDILEYLGQKYELHIITNGFEEAQERKMINSEIKHYFKTITNSEMVGVKKPNPKIFKFALELAKADPKESIMIGDSLEADIEGAHKVGMSGILFNNGEIQNLFDDITTISHLEELKKYL
jgi:putative hydrolase of the HAD superfamily